MPRFFHPLVPCQAAPLLAIAALLSVLQPANAQFGSNPFSQNGSGNFRNDPNPIRVPNYTPHDAAVLVEVAVAGREHVEESKIRSLLQTRVGRNYDPDQVQRDVRALIASGLFRNVKTYRKDVPGGVSVTFEVFELPVVQYVRFLGNEHRSEKKLTKQVGVRVGSPLNRYTVEESRRKLQQYYLDQGFPEAQVMIVEGDQPEHQGVVFQITEGTRQRIVSVHFEGNSNIASDGRLKTQIKSKPAILWSFGGNVVPNQIEQDVDRLTAYYRALGFYRATIRHAIQYSEDRSWLTVVFHINEGPRYRIRDIRLEGQEIFTAQQLLGQTQLRRGDYYNIAQLQRDLSAIRDEYGSQGYMFASVEAETKLFEQPGILDIVYHIDEGEQYRVGRIIVKIDGDERDTRRSAVLNRISIRPGDVLNLREIRNSERRLMASQLFLTDPAQGIAPSISVKPPNPDTQIARDPGSPSAVRGQSPVHSVQRPIVDVEVTVRTKTSPVEMEW